MIIALTGGVILSCLPYFTDYFFFGADTIFHLQRIECLKNTLLENFAFPVRVQNTWLYGHGYMVSVFYGDLFFLFPALLRIIGFPIVTSYKIFVFAVMALSAIIAYVSLQKCLKNRQAALFGALIYLLAPYRLYNFYNRGAAGEYLAMTFMPLVCCGMYLLLTEDVNSPKYKNYKWYLIGGISAILQSHLLSTEMTAFFMAVVCLAAWRRIFRKETLLQLVWAVVGVIVLNCWYWLPMLYMLRIDAFNVENVFEIQIQEIGIWLARLVQLVPNAGNTHLGVRSADPIQPGATITFMLLVYGLLRWVKEIGKPKKELSAFMWLTILAIVMSTKYFPWDTLARIPGIQFFATSLQFPTRLMASAALFGAWFAAFFLREIMQDEEKTLRWKHGFCTLFIVLTVVSALYHTNSMLSRAVPSYFYTVQNIGTISVGNGEYMIDGTWVTDYYYHKPVADEGITWCDYRKNGTDISLIVENTTSADRYLEFPLIGYPGYVVSGEAGMEKPFIADERGMHEDLRIVIPPNYAGKIDISYKGLPVFKIAELISAVGFGVLVIWILRKGRRAWQQK